MLPTVFTLAEVGAPDMVWHAQNLRLTVFPTPGSDLSQAPNWERLVGHPAEETINRGGQLAEMGRVGRAVLQLAKQPPLRADLVYGAVPSPEDDPTEPFALGPVEREIQVFGPLAEAFLTEAPPLQRVAFGAELLHPRETRDEAYRYFDEAIHGAALDLDGASEFFYQINRPRESAVVRGLSLNRLAKWSASKWQRVVFDANVGRRTVGPEGYGNHLSLDINTPAEYPEALPPRALPDLFRELVRLALEIADRGDIR